MANCPISAHQTVVWHRQDSPQHGDRRVPLRAVRILDEWDIEKCRAIDEGWGHGMTHLLFYSAKIYNLKVHVTQIT